MKENKVLTSEALNAEMILNERIRQANEIVREEQYEEMVDATAESIAATQESKVATEHSIEVTTDVETKLANGEFNGHSGVWVGEDEPLEDDYNVWIDVDSVEGNFATVATTGSYNDLLDKPTSLPADGGDADTIGGKTPDAFVQTDKIINKLDTTQSGFVLDGRQGKVLDDKIKRNADAIDELKNSTSEDVDPEITDTSLLTFKTKTFQVKGQLHCHTNQSDGVMTAEELLNGYAALGFDFVAITDHDSVHANQGVANIIQLVGTEYYVGDKHGHICAYGVNKPRPDVDKIFDYQTTLDFIKNNGGISSIAHPTFSGLEVKSEEAAILQGYNCVEIHNGYSDDDYEEYVDSLLTKGKRFNLLSTDDFHDSAKHEMGKSYIMVNVDEKTDIAIMDSIKRGNYYSSTGNDLSLTLENAILTASTTEESIITFITNKGKTSTTGTTATYTLNGDEVYVRVRTEKTADAASKSWSNPIYITKKNVSVYKNPLGDFTLDSSIPYYVGGSVTNNILQLVTHGGEALENEFTNEVLSMTLKTGTTMGALLFNKYDLTLRGRTIKVSADVYNPLDEDMKLFMYTGTGDIGDYSCVTGRKTTGVTIPKNTDFQYVEIYGTCDLDVTRMLAQVKYTRTNTTTDETFKIKNFNVSILEDGLPAIGDSVGKPYKLSGHTKLATGVDLNNVKDYGQYMSDSWETALTITNKPIESAFTLTVENALGATGKAYLRQTFKHIVNQTEYRRMYDSYSNGGTWSDWEEVLTTAKVANNLLTTQAGMVLDARQGKALNDKIGVVNNNLSTLSTSLGVVIINKTDLGTTVAKTVESMPTNSHLIKDFWAPLSDIPSASGDYYTLEICRGTLELSYTRIMLSGSTKLWIGHYANGVVTWTEK